MIDSLIVDLERMKREDTPLERANRFLEAYSVPGTGKAGHL